MINNGSNRSPGPGRGHFKQVLSKRNLELLQYLADGKTIKDAGGLMCIAEATAKNMMYSIRNFLESETTTHAVVTALRQGLID